MPYVITAERPIGYALSLGRETVSRRAVATLAEARRVATGPIYASRSRAEMSNGQAQPFYDEAAALPEAGGTVGPLPDGTVIEVERVSGYALAQRTIAKGRVIGLDPRSPNAEKQRLILDAYNAAQA